MKPQSTSPYGGFWRRALATLFDTLLMTPVVVVLLQLSYGRDYWRWVAEGGDGMFYGAGEIVFGYLLPAVFIVGCWCLFKGTPGKRVLGLAVVDARTGNPLSPARATLRLLAYLVSYIPLGLGFLWIAWDKRKQGFHDKIARSLVVREQSEPLSLEEIARRLS